MPIMRVSYPQGALNAERKAALAKRLTDELIAMEGGAGTRGGQAFASVLMTEIAEDSWWVGGHLDGTFVAKAGKFLVDVSIPEGYMNAAQKTDVHVSVNEAIVAVTGHQADADAGANILVVIHEVPEGNWGADGKTISLGEIATAVGLAPTAVSVPLQRLTFDRPYLLLVTATGTAEPLFLARVANPAAG